MNKDFTKTHKYLTIVNGEQLANITAESILTPLEEYEYKKLSLPKQKQRLLGRIAAKQAIKKYYSEKSISLEYQQIEILNEPSGKPYSNIKHPCLSANELLISISHSDNYAIANTVLKHDNTGLGVDIEKIRNLDEVTVQRFLSNQEKAIYQKIPQDKKNETAIIYWSAKEAYFKACKSTSINLKEIDVVIERMDNLMKLKIIDPALDKLIVGYCGIIYNKFIITNVVI